MKSEQEIIKPPFWHNLTAAIFRSLPPIKGRGRLESLFHYILKDRGWSSVVKVNDYLMEVSLDDLIGRNIYLNGCFERMNTEIMKKILFPGAVVFDVGANTGYYSLLFSLYVGESGRVYSFEPVHDILLRLYNNIERNVVLSKSIKIFEFCLSDKNGFLEINISGPKNLGASHVKPLYDANDNGRSEAGIVKTSKVPCKTGDLVWTELDCPPIDIIKMDIEGHEMQALQGMVGVLKTMKKMVVLVEVKDHFLRAAGSSSAELYRFMNSLGYFSYDYNHKESKFEQMKEVCDGELVVFSRKM